MHFENIAQSRGGQSHNKPRPTQKGSTKHEKIMIKPAKRFFKIGIISLFMANPINKNAKFTKGLKVLTQTARAD
jgi:hypothetical protein